MKELKEDIKSGAFRRIYLFYGEEDYLKRIYRDKMKEAILGDGAADMNYSYFYGKDIDQNELREMVNTLPFFSERRLVIVEDSGLFKLANDLRDGLADMPDTTVLVFVEKEVDKRNKLYNFVKKQGLPVEMNGMSDKELKNWVALGVKNSGHQIKGSTAEYFLEQVDNSMNNIKNELEKLIAYTEGREEITKADVDQVCSVQATSRIFQMLDAVAMGKQAEVLMMYHDLLILRENAMALLYLLTRHFHILLQVKSLPAGMGRGEAAKKVGVPPFAIGKYQSQSRRFSSERLKSMLEACIETEYQFKRGNINDRLGVEMLLVSFLNGTKK